MIDDVVKRLALYSGFSALFPIAITVGGRPSNALHFAEASAAMAASPSLSRRGAMGIRPMTAYCAQYLKKGICT